MPSAGRSRSAACRISAMAATSAGWSGASDTSMVPPSSTSPAASSRSRGTCWSRSVAITSRSTPAAPAASASRPGGQLASNRITSSRGLGVMSPPFPQRTCAAPPSRIPAMRTSRGGRAVLLVAALASVVWLARPAAAAPPPNRSQLAGAPVGVLVLVRQLTWDQAAVAASGHGRPMSAGLVSTLPADASLADRVLSLAAERLETVPGELLVIAVRDAAGLEQVLARVQAPGGARARVLVVGLQSPPGRARTAPLLAIGGPGEASGVVTSDSTRRSGLVAFQDVRPTLTGSMEGTQGAPIRSVPRADPLGFVGHLDRQVGALVSARTLAVVLYAVLGTVALAACLAALLTAGRAGWVGAVARRMRPLARALVLVSLAVPSGYLIASAVAPTSWVAWLLLGLVAAALLTLAAWLLAGGSGAARAAPGAAATAGGGWAAPALLGGLLTALVVLDLLAGGDALTRPLLGNSAFDGERFYGLGNGYFAHALAGIFLVVAFRRLPARAVAALLAGLAVVDGLPSLGADVGGALTAMLSAAAALLLLGGSRPSPSRIR